MHEVASKTASDVLNNGKGLEYLVTNGWTIDQIRERIKQGG